MQKALNKQRGFSLVEAMISLIVIAVGLLGLSGMQMASVKGTNTAHFRTSANLLALSLGDRMRANKNGVRDNLYNTNNPAIAGALNCATAPPNCSAIEPCDSLNTAIRDIHDTMCGVGMGGLSTSLLNGQLTVQCMDRTPGAAPFAIACGYKVPHEITITWDDVNTHKDQEKTQLKANGTQEYSVRHEVIVL